MGGVFLDHFRRAAGDVEDEGDVDRIVVGEEAVAELIFLAERLAVVGCDDDDSLGQGSAFLERIEKAPELGVDESHFSRVGVFQVLCPEGLRRRIGVVRVEDVDPAEPLPVLGGDPVHGRGDDLVGRPFDDVEFVEVGPARIVVVDDESLVEAEPGVEDESSDEGARFVIVALQRLGQSQVAAFELEPGVVAHSVVEGRCSRHDIGMGRTGQGRLGVGVREDGGPAGQGVEVGGLDILVGQYPHPVVPERVDRDEKDVHILPRRRPGPQSGQDRGQTKYEQKNGP